MDGRPGILITGFGPFPHVRVNPTTALALRVSRKLAQARLKADLLVMETSYAVGLPALKDHLAQTRPKAVLMLGLAARARFVRVELFGRGHASRLHPDATGATPTDAPANRSALPLRTSGNPAGAQARRHPHPPLGLGRALSLRRLLCGGAAPDGAKRRAGDLHPCAVAAAVARVASAGANPLVPAGRNRSERGSRRDRTRSRAHRPATQLISRSGATRCSRTAQYRWHAA